MTDRDELIIATAEINKAFQKDPSLIDSYRAEYAFRNIAVLSDRMDSGNEISAISDNHMRSLRRLEERVAELVDCEGVVHPLHKLQQIVRDHQVTEAQRQDFVNILLDGNNLLMSMLPDCIFTASIINYFLGNTNAAPHS